MALIVHVRWRIASRGKVYGHTGIWVLANPFARLGDIGNEVLSGV